MRCEDYFDDLLFQITPDWTTQTLATGAQRLLEELLRSALPELEGIYSFGSSSRGTSISPQFCKDNKIDVDLLAGYERPALLAAYTGIALAEAKFRNERSDRAAKQLRTKGTTPERELVRRLMAALKSSPAVENAYEDFPSAAAKLRGCEIVVEITPALSFGDGSFALRRPYSALERQYPYEAERYALPAMGNDDFITEVVTPLQLNLEMDRLSQAFGEWWADLVKVLKYWNFTQRFPLRSFVLETAVFDALHDAAAYAGTPTTLQLFASMLKRKDRYHWGLLGRVPAFANLADRMQAAARSEAAGRESEALSILRACFPLPLQGSTAPVDFRPARGTASLPTIQNLPAVSHYGGHQTADKALSVAAVYADEAIVGKPPGSTVEFGIIVPNYSAGREIRAVRNPDQGLTAPSRKGQDYRYRSGSRAAKRRPKGRATAGALICLLAVASWYWFGSGPNSAPRTATASPAASARDAVQVASPPEYGSGRVHSSAPVLQPDFAGIWKGSCGQGSTALVIEIRQLMRDKFNATIGFRSTSGVRGKYKLFGGVDPESRVLALSPVDWITKASDARMLGFSLIPSPSGQLAGTLENWSYSEARGEPSRLACGKFILHRQGNG